MADDDITSAYAPQSPYAIALPSSDYGSAEAYDPHLTKYRTAFAEREKQREQIEAKQQLSADQMSTILKDAASTIRKNREGRSNLPLMALGANMMGPGDFGTQVGRGLQAMVPAIQKQREQDDQEEVTLANLGVKAEEMQNAPLKTKLDYIKALQIGDMQTIRAIETAQIRAQAQQQAKAGALTADQKEFAQAQAEDPALKGWTLQKWKEWKAHLQAGNRPPAELQIAQALMKDDPALSVTDALVKAKNQAAEAQASGKARAEAKQQLPGVQINAEMIADTVRQLQGLPLEEIVGKPWSSVVALPSSEKSKFEALEKMMQGQAFTQAFESLRGGGAITEVEGLKATQSRLAAARNMKPEDYRAALEEYNYWVQRAVRTVKEKAGEDVSQIPMPQKPPAMLAREKAGQPQVPQGSPSPPGQTGQRDQKPGSVIGQPATAQGKPVREGRTGVDDATGRKVIAKGGVWVDAEGQ